MKKNLYFFGRITKKNYIAYANNKEKIFTQKASRH